MDAIAVKKTIECDRNVEYDCYQGYCNHNFYIMVYYYRIIYCPPYVILTKFPNALFIPPVPSPPTPLHQIKLCVTMVIHTYYGSLIHN